MVSGGYQNFEILLIDYGSQKKETFAFYDSLKTNEKIHYLAGKPP
jgi:hypothetical protein